MPGVGGCLGRDRRASSCSLISSLSGNRADMYARLSLLITIGEELIERER